MRYLYPLLFLLLTSCSAEYHAFQSNKHRRKAISKGYEFPVQKVKVPNQDYSTRIETRYDTLKTVTTGDTKHDTIISHDTIYIYKTRIDTLTISNQSTIDTVISIKGYDINLTTDGTYVTIDAIADTTYSVQVIDRPKYESKDGIRWLIVLVIVVFLLLLIKIMK